MTEPRYEMEFSAGARCACDCGCGRTLTPDNVMGEDVTDNPDTPWEVEGESEPRIVLLICVDCYTGAHPTPESNA